MTDKNGSKSPLGGMVSTALSDGNQRPHVLHVLDHSLPLHSGYTFRTLSILEQQRRLGWVTSHLTGPKQGVTESADETSYDWHFYRTPWQHGSAPRVPGLIEWWQIGAIERRLDELVEMLEPDIIHAHSPALNAIPALRVARRHGLPVVYEVRAFWEDAAVDHGTTHAGSLRYRLTRALETYALRRVDAVTCICEGLRSDIVARGVASERVTVIPNAVDAGRFSFRLPRDQELAEELGLESEATVLGFIGSFYAYEGLDLVLDALPRILARHPNVKLLLVGGGPQNGNLQAYAERLGVQDAVMFTGRVPHDTIGRYYSLVDAFVYPRHSIRLTELVTPLKPLEAMAMGKPVIASDIGGHRELIRHGDNGILFPADDVTGLIRAVDELLRSPERFEQIIERGREFVERERTWESSVARYRDVYGLPSADNSSLDEARVEP